MIVDFRLPRRRTVLKHLSRGIMLGALMFIGAIAISERASAQTFVSAWAPSFQGVLTEPVYSYTIPSGSVGPNDLVVVAWYTGPLGEIFQPGTVSDSIGDTYAAPQLEGGWELGGLGYTVTPATFNGSLTVTTSIPMLGIRVYSGYNSPITGIRVISGYPQASFPAEQPGALTGYNTLNYNVPDFTGSFFTYFDAGINIGDGQLYPLPPQGYLIVTFGYIMNAVGGSMPYGWPITPSGSNPYEALSWFAPAVPTAAQYYNFSFDNIAPLPNNNVTMADEQTVGFSWDPKGAAIILTAAIQAP